MQKEITLKTNDGHTIYGTLDSQEESKTLLIFVHGLTGHQNEHHYFNAVPFFTKEGFHTFRFNFYAEEDNARQSSDCSITTHVQDLEQVINHFTKKYDEIILIGHSLGPLVILSSDLSKVAKLVLWDPTSGFDKIEDKNGYYDSNLKKYVLRRGMEVILGEQMIEEWKKLNPKDLVGKITVPCKFIFSENCDKHEIWQPFLDQVKVEKDVVIIKNATHGFIEEGTELELFKETLKWLK